MKTSSLALLSLIGVAAAGKPQLSIQVKDGSFGGLDGLDPSISWSGSSSSGDVDLEYGVDASASSLTNIASLPKKFWGKASADVGGWATSVRADVDSADIESADLEVDAVNGDLALKMFASAGKAFAVRRVEATKSFDSDGAKITLNPRYNLETEEADIIASWDTDDTNVELTASTDSQSVKVSHQMGDTNLELNASADAQSLTISQQLDESNRVAPTLTSSGGVSLEWERSLGDDNSLTAKVIPDEAIDLEWKDEAWTANINMPISGANIEGANVSIKREVNF